MLEQGIPLEAILTELFFSGEVERTYRQPRQIGFSGQLEFHSPTSQSGQLSRRGSYGELDLAPIMRRIVGDIASGRFPDEWDAANNNASPCAGPCSIILRCCWRMNPPETSIR